MSLMLFIKKLQYWLKERLEEAFNSVKRPYRFYRRDILVLECWCLNCWSKPGLAHVAKLGIGKGIGAVVTFGRHFS